LFFPFRFRRSALLASRFVLDLSTAELAASFLTLAIYAFNITLETAHSVKPQGFGHHLRRRADFVASSSYFEFVVYLFLI
jgi:hypothetical protein